MGRILGGIFAALAGLLVLFLMGGFVYAYEGWWVSVLIGFPLTWFFFGLAWAVWTGRRVRPTAGTLIALGALWYAVFFVYATFYISRAVAESSEGLAGLAYFGLLVLWPIVFLSTLLAWAFLRSQDVSWTRLIFFGISLAWFAAWLGFWLIWLPKGMTPLDPETWFIHGFFLLPALLTMGLAHRSG